MQQWASRWTDKDLYAKYGVAGEEIAFIEKIVRPMDLSTDLFDDVTVDDSDDG
jgi:site-specific DNA-methyltransferase (adenine-specific)